MLTNILFITESGIKPLSAILFKSKFSSHISETFIALTFPTLANEALYWLIIIAISALLVIFIIITLIQKQKISQYKRFQFLIQSKEKGIKETLFLKQLVNQIPDYIYVKDRKSRFVFANDKLAKSVKLPSGEMMVGKTDYDFFSKELAKEYYDDEQKLMCSNKAIVNKIEPVQSSDIYTRWLSTTKIPIHDKKNNVIGLIGIGRDMSDIKESTAKLIEQTESLKRVNQLLEEKNAEINIQKEQLQLEKTQLRTLIDHLPDLIYFKDANAKFVTVNKKLLNIIKLNSVEEAVGKNDYDFFPKEMADKYYSDDMNVISTGEPLLHIEEEGTDENDIPTVVLTSKVPLFNESGEVTGMIGIGRDITRQKLVEKKYKEQSEHLKDINSTLELKQREIEEKNTRIEDERNQLRILIDNMPDTIYFKNTKAEFILANKTLSNNLKFANDDEIIGKTDFDIFPKEMAETFYQDDMNIIKNGKVIINKEERGLDKDGNEIIKSTTKVAIKDSEDNIIGLIGIGRDITKQKETEKILIQQSNDLQEVNIQLEERQEEIQQQSEELLAQAETLEGINNELSKLNNTKNKFFNIIAHDLKNPFHAIMGFSELISRQYDTMEDKQRKDLLQYIHSSSEKAFDLLENLLQWSRAQTGAIKCMPENLRIKNNIDTTIDFHKLNALKKNITLYSVVKHQMIAYADNNMVNTILRNLIGNAIKYTGSDGLVTISSEEQTKAGKEKMIKINITDTGTGMNQEDIDNLFRIDSYYSTKGTDGETGTGLGLIICKEFVEINGGEFMVKSKAGEGSTFSFTLPLNED